ncbi:HAMP domain-containing histidine kinase [Actinoplanes sp. KI2]|uniref:sensor histidine kinase n=1 Tax=Actinoplanes sp. KI2 TaxID=2983315 RepID=UPI0021D593E6|nr:HAMP domain-containing sensor histidine kinase [Actinoplanes sp. KI2]MCU7724957.1 HAMP domain-containing histidine kinase [Actinoplanes sp. KI2]
MSRRGWTGSRRIPLRHRLVTRLLLTVIGVLVVAVGATAWLAAQTATRAIRQEQGRSLADEKGLYEALVGYAATHPDWSAVGPLLHDRARALGRRVTLTTAQRQVIADSSAGPPPAMSSPAATVDPLRLDLGVTGGTEIIDGRVVGPYRLTAGETQAVDKIAQDVLTCLASAGVEGRIVGSPSGRPTPVVVRGGDPKDAMSQCGARFAGWSMPSEEKALRGLAKLMATCLGQPDPSFIGIQVNWAASPPSFAAIDGSAHPRGGARVRSCLDQSRRAQLEPYTAPAALLFVTDPDTGLARTTFNLSRGNVIRIAAVTGGILLVTILVTVLLGRRLVRPLRVLTESAARQTPAPVTTRDEIGYLATVLNEAMRRRGEAEAQRRAMVGDIAHELRNPLTNVRSWVEAAQDGLARPDAQLLALLHDETVVLQHVVDDLADLAAADAGTLSLHLAPVDLGEALSQVVAAHATDGLTLSVAVAPATKINADPVRLRQLVGNLVTNAVRYTPPGGTVVVTGSLEGGEAVITVRDTGIGIAPDDLPRVFDRFWRADVSRSRTTGGSGLGLAIARQLARAHGGDITVSSTIGVGTTFTVRFGGLTRLEP